MDRVRRFAGVEGVIGDVCALYLGPVESLVKMLTT